MNRAWRAEVAAAVVGFAAAALIGLAFGHIISALLAAAVVYLAWHLANAILLYRRLRGAGGRRAPHPLGLWRDIEIELRRHEQTRRDFVGNASHELRTPLTVLRGYLDLINDEAVSRGELREWERPLDDMLQQTVRMEDIVGDMLALARLESEETRAGSEPVNVPELIEHIVRQAESVSSGRHAIRPKVQEGLLLKGQANELQSAFSNLVLNAVQHTPEGCEISVFWEPRGTGARFAVSDNGPGIDAEDIPRLTERFYRVDVGRSRASGGTGLGLAIVKHALERHDSTLTIDSAPGRGAIFTCVFPPRRTLAATR